MKTSTIKLKITKTFPFTSTRAEGIQAREKLLQLLETHPSLILDFAKTQITVSFADECLGVLIEKLGKKEFQQKIILENISPTLQSLLSHILTRRMIELGKK